MKSRITKVLFISLLFSAKISPAAEMEEERDLPITAALYANKTLEKIRSLVEKNASVDEKNRHGDSVLILATHENRVDVVRFLLENKANVNGKTRDGCSALCLAMNLEVQAVLEKNGAENHHTNFLTESLSEDESPIELLPEDKLLLKFSRGQ